MNWESLRHQIGDMFDEEELASVLVQLPDGRLAVVVDFKKIDQVWRLTLVPDEDRSER